MAEADDSIDAMNETDGPGDGADRRLAHAHEIDGHRADTIGGAELVFVLAGLAIGLAFFLLAQWILPGEFFQSDDFAFLAEVQRPDWSWRAALLPIDSWSYWNVRPLGVDAYFRLGTYFFGAQPLGFFEINVLVHFATAPVVFRLARQLGLGHPASAVAALLCISRPPSMHLLYYGAGFASLAAQLLIASSLSCHLDWIRGGRKRWLGASLGLVFVALLTHEIAYFTPFVLAAASLLERRDAPWRTRISRSLRDVAPALAVVVPYVIVRFTLFAPLRSDAGYGRIYALRHVLRHLRAQLEMLASEPLAFWALALVCVAVAGVGLARGASRRSVTTTLLPMLGFCVVWTIVALAPILLLPNPHVRYSHYAEVPVALAAAACVGFVLSGLGHKAQNVAFVALALWLALIMPWATLADRVDRAPRTKAAKFAAEVRAHVDPMPQNVTFVVRHGAEPLASTTAKNQFSRQVHSGTTLVQALWREKNPVLHFQDVTQAWRHVTICDTCIYIDMTSAGTFEVLDDETIADAVFEPALQSERRGIQMAAARQLARRQGLEALPRLEAACRAHAFPDACRTRVEMAIARSEAGDASPLLKALRRAHGSGDQPPSSSPGESPAAPPEGNALPSSR